MEIQGNAFRGQGAAEEGQAASDTQSQEEASSLSQASGHSPRTMYMRDAQGSQCNKESDSILDVRLLPASKSHHSPSPPAPQLGKMIGKPRHR